MSRNFEMYRSYSEAQDRFDNFVLAGLLAVCAYLGQGNPYAPIGLNTETVYLLSLASFVLSALFGFKRIEYMIVGYRLNYQLLDAREKKIKTGKTKREANWKKSNRRRSDTTN